MDSVAWRSELVTGLALMPRGKSPWVTIGRDSCRPCKALALVAAHIFIWSD